MSLPLSLELAELPSPQHRAGLAGLVAILHLLRLDSSYQLAAQRLDLDLDLGTLERLFTVLYQGTDAVRLRVTRPTGVESEQVTLRQADGTEAVRYRYLQRRPAGCWLSHLPHHQLWQDVVWQTLRSVLLTRKVYNQPTDQLARSVFSALQRQARGQQASLPLAGPLYAGARARTAEGVNCKALPHHALLLHFAHAVALPFMVGGEGQGKSNWTFRLLAYPDPDDLMLLSQPVTLPARVSGIHEAGLCCLHACSHLPRVFLALFEEKGHSSSVVQALHLRRAPGMETGYSRWAQPLRDTTWRGLVSENLTQRRDPRHGLGRLLRTVPAQPEDAHSLCPAHLSLVEGFLRAATQQKFGNLANPDQRSAARRRLALDLRRRLRSAHSSLAVAALMLEMAAISNQHLEAYSPSSTTADDLLHALAACGQGAHLKEISEPDEETPV
jgi:hypothetical protein